MYKVTFSIDGEEKSHEGETTKDVCDILKQLNMLKAYGKEAVDVVITDPDDKVLTPVDVGMEPPKKYKSRIANAIDRIQESEGSREDFEWLVEVIAATKPKGFEVKKALDEVFGGWEPDVATMDKAVFEVSDEEKEADKKKFNTTIITDDGKKDGEGLNAFEQAMKKKYGSNDVQEDAA